MRGPAGGLQGDRRYSSCPRRFEASPRASHAARHSDRWVQSQNHKVLLGALMARGSAPPIYRQIYLWKTRLCFRGGGLKLPGHGLEA
jgi:hypothetical protein